MNDACDDDVVTPDALSCLYDDRPQLYARIPARTQDYASAAYWRRRYAAEAASAGADAAGAPTYDWYDVRLASLLTAAQDAGVGLAPASVVLHLGCGTSAWGAALAAAGHVVLDTDVDAALLAAARAKEEGITTTGKLLYAAVDATCPALRPRSVCFVLEKGTLDALHCAPGACYPYRGVYTLLADVLCLLRLEVQVSLAQPG